MRQPEGGTTTRLVKEFGLVAQLGADPVADQGQALGAVGDFDLAATDGGGAAHLGLPDAGVGGP